MRNLNKAEFNGMVIAFRKCLMALVTFIMETSHLREREQYHTG